MLHLLEIFIISHQTIAIISVFLTGSIAILLQDVQHTDVSSCVKESINGRTIVLDSATLM